MSDTNLYVPVIQLRPKSAIKYDMYIGDRKKKTKAILNEKKNITEHKKLAYKNQFSESARKRLTKKINILVQSSKKVRIYNEVTNKYINHRLSFITLTVSSNENKKLEFCYTNLLKPFLRIMRNKHGLTTYIWKAEVQQRGQIHYHITTPSFIHYQIIRDTWNNIQSKAGCLDDYVKSKGHFDANSTDVHEVKHVQDLASYLVKEFCKSIQNNFLDDGKKWDCSNNLNNINYFEILETTENVLIEKEMLQKDEIYVDTHDRYAIIDFKRRKPTELLTLSQLKDYKEYIKFIQNKVNCYK